MKFRYLTLILAILMARASHGQPSELELLKQELKALKDKAAELETKIQRLETKPVSRGDTEARSGELQKKAEKVELPSQAGPAQPPAEESSAATAKTWSPADPMRLLSRGGNYLNLSLDALFALGGSTAGDVEELQLGAHDPKQRGFTIQNVEMTLDGAIDPYFRGQASLIFLLSPEGESEFELEEAYLETFSLPGNLQLRAGQLMTEFGRHNPTHPHAWQFVDSPLPAARFLGGDGLRNPGARLSWLAPTPFYSELFLTVQNSQGETASSFRDRKEGAAFLGRFQQDRGVQNLRDLLFTPRYALSFELTSSQTLLLGSSAAFGPNASGASTDTQIYGVDFYWKWKPLRHSGGFPFVSLQAEAMLRSYEAGFYTDDPDGDGLLAAGDPDLFGNGVIDAAPEETLEDYGFYAQLAYGFRPRWIAALRGDYVAPHERGEYERLFGDDIERAARWRISPNLTWHPTEFSKIRLQYNYDYRRLIGPDHSLWLQFEFLMGAHGAHKF